MRTRTPVFVSVLAVLAVLPSVVFLKAALLRDLQPPQYQPARTAQAVFDAFAALSSTGLWLMLGLAPAIGLLLAGLAIWLRLRDDQAARADVAAFWVGCVRLLHQPVLVAAALAGIASAGVLTFAVVHAIAG